MNVSETSPETTTAQSTSWLEVRAEFLRRINERVWIPGEAIPNEAELAQELDCARATVNRALRDLAEKGLVTRKRRAGTRVKLNPPAHVTLQIPIYREEIEEKGMAYRHVILQREITIPPNIIRHRLDLAEGSMALSITTMHLGDGRPYALDQRWINLSTVAEAASCNFDRISPNEWLVQNAPYSHGDIAFFAENASQTVAEHLGVNSGDALLVLDRLTWRNQSSITTTRISFAPGHRILTGI